MSATTNTSGAAGATKTFEDNAGVGANESAAVRSPGEYQGSTGIPQGGIHQDVGNMWLLPAELPDGQLLVTASQLVEQLGIDPKASILCVDMEPRAVMDAIDDMLMGTTQTLKFKPGEPAVPLRAVVQRVADVRPMPELIDR